MGSSEGGGRGASWEASDSGLTGGELSWEARSSQWRKARSRAAAFIALLCLRIHELEQNNAGSPKSVPPAVDQMVRGRTQSGSGDERTSMGWYP